MNGLLIRAAGPRSLIQDRGRFGHHGLGITTGGPLDWIAWDWANRLLDNPADAAAVEITLGPLELEAMIPTTLAVTGPATLRINNRTRPAWQCHAVMPGDRIAVGVKPAGLCAYLALAGGVQSRPMLGSRATVTREGLGGLHGRDTRPLRTGDFLPVDPDIGTPIRSLAHHLRPDYGQAATLRMLPGFQWRQFGRAARRQLADARFTVSPQSSRMGLRLTGPPIPSPEGAKTSEGVCAGAIQITPDGQPIVLLADRQTIGGYPKPGAVITADLPRLGQLRPGAMLQFQPVTPATARAALAQIFQRFEAGERSWRHDTPQTR
ncbi:MAG: biotin-dependent carboxyltransferase family protein [Abyssibacter sp.]|uniref:5-oxoprolinase subunit C family protein n=1 Tax=Abyssibacter sp. TaxID=2320200 RepID=UPI00321AC289